LIEEEGMGWFGEKREEECLAFVVTGEDAVEKFLTFCKAVWIQGSGRK